MMIKGGPTDRFALCHSSTVTNPFLKFALLHSFINFVKSFAPERKIIKGFQLV